MCFLFLLSIQLTYISRPPKSWVQPFSEFWSKNVSRCDICHLQACPTETPMCFMLFSLLPARCSWWWSPIDPCFSESGPWISSIGITWHLLECELLGAIPGLLKQNLHLTSSPSDTCMHSSLKHKSLDWKMVHLQDEKSMNPWIVTWRKVTDWLEISALHSRKTGR